MGRLKFDTIATVVTIVSLALSSTWIQDSQANVNLKNGDFFTSYVDIFYPGGSEPKIRRVYNSKTPFKGIFGWGWGTEYEVYLSVSADGSVVVHEYGGGAENRFVPVKFNAEELTTAIEQIASVAQKSGMLGSRDAATTYRERLKNDATYRNDEWEKFRAQNKIQPRAIAKGTQLHSLRFNYQYITKTVKGYVRISDSGLTEEFNPGGKLTRLVDKNNNSIDFEYGKDGHLKRLSDNFKRKMFFTFNEQGLLSRLDGENSKFAEYKYNPRGELMSSRDVAGNVYGFRYDSEGRHNMIQVDYADKTSTIVTYYGQDKHESVKSVKDRDNTSTDYDYKDDPGNKKHTTVMLKIKDTDGKLLSSNQYEYFTDNKADGEEWTRELVTDLDGDKTRTIYSETCGLPTFIQKGSEQTKFDYDIKCHVTRKTTPTDITDLRYDARVSKVDQVTRTSAKDKKVLNWSQFEYDPKGNLLFARNSASESVRLAYDSNGRIGAMVDEKKQTITFKYNEDSKPVEIRDPALGAITVNYNNTGEIKDVESKSGHEIAVKVSAEFQKLLQIVGPAGVPLSF